MARICFFRLGATPLFITGSDQTFGGAEVRAFTFARALAQRGNHDVCFAVKADPALPLQHEGIDLIGIPKLAGGIAKLARSVRRRFGKEPLTFPSLKKIDSDAVASFGIHDPTPSVIRTAELRGMTTFLFLTSSEDVRALSPGGKAKQRRRENGREFALRHASQIVVQTEYQQTELLKNFGLPSQLIRNPIDCAISPEALQQNRKHVLWVGRADTDSKRADLCLELAKSCPDVAFRMVMNDADSNLGRKLQNDCPSNVTIEQHVPFGEIDRLYATATLLINTSVSEGFPNAFLQAAKFATPIVALNVDPDGMLSKHGCGEMAGTLSNMVELVRRYHSGDERNELGSVAREYVLRHHDLAARANELAKLLECTILSRRAA